MVISSDFCMGQYRDDDQREDAPHFIFQKLQRKMCFLADFDFRSYNQNRNQLGKLFSLDLFFEKISPRISETSKTLYSICTRENLNSKKFHREFLKFRKICTRSLKPPVFKIHVILVNGTKNTGHFDYL